jgi:hypothetical protein
MNLKFYKEKLQQSSEYRKFLKENPKAYFCGGFFKIDRENLKTPNNQAHLDFYNPETKKIFSFKLEEGIKKIPIKEPSKVIPPKISKNLNFNFEKIEEILDNEIETRKIKNKIKQILFSLQNLKEKDYLIITIFLSSLGLLKVILDLETKKITSFEKKSFFDMVKVFKNKKPKKNQEETKKDR